MHKNTPYLKINETQSNQKVDPNHANSNDWLSTKVTTSNKEQAQEDYKKYKQISDQVNINFFLHKNEKKKKKWPYT